MLALLVGCALRRNELAELEIETIQAAGGKMGPDDLKGRGRRICDNPTRILAGGVFPFVRLKSHSGEQYPMAEAFAQEITKLYEEREQEREARHIQASLSPQRGPRLSNLSLERFRTSTKYRDGPAAADIAFCIAAYANGMTEDRIERALEGDYLSRDPSPSKRAAYIRRTMEKAKRWAER